MADFNFKVAIHNKNGKGLLPCIGRLVTVPSSSTSQSTIKMDKGYYKIDLLEHLIIDIVSQSTIKMDKGYYI